MARRANSARLGDEANVGFGIAWRKRADSRQRGITGQAYRMMFLFIFYEYLLGQTAACVHALGQPSGRLGLAFFGGGGVHYNRPFGFRGAKLLF